LEGMDATLTVEIRAPGNGMTAMTQRFAGLTA
jgi:hypothetical protein